MVDITLFELHLDEASFSNAAPFLGGGEAEEGAAATDTSGGGAKGKLFAFLALGGIVAVAWLISRSEVGEEIEIDEAVELTN
ncbi:hypothetical protein [Halorientalis halophila]|uniref:hypothetical protein n=1 Tax=Halorientalis halophila TaxID=3108499 RepID=UPI0030099615